MKRIYVHYKDSERQYTRDFNYSISHLVEILSILVDKGVELVLIEVK